MPINRSGFEQQFMSMFRKGAVTAFIIVTDPSNGRPIITLIHRARFGSEILPIPAWLNQSKAEQFLQNNRGILQKDKVIEVTHQSLQEMIENREYARSSVQKVSYHLDLLADESEIKDFLSLNSG